MFYDHGRIWSSHLIGKDGAGSHQSHLQPENYLWHLRGAIHELLDDSQRKSQRPVILQVCQGAMDILTYPINEN